MEVLKNKNNIMYTKIMRCLLPMLLLSGCVDKDYFSGDWRVVAKDPPAFVAPAVYASANLKDIFTKQSEGKDFAIRADEKGVLHLYSTFKSIYKAQPLDMVAGQDQEFSSRSEWTLPIAGLPVESLPPISDIELPDQEGELTMILSDKVTSIDRLQWGCKLSIKGSDMPLDMLYRLELLDIKDADDKPLVIEWSTDKDGNTLERQLKGISIQKIKGNVLSMRYRLSSRILSLNTSVRTIPQTLSIETRLSEVEIEKFEGRLSSTIDLKFQKPIVFAYEDWDLLEDLEIQGSNMTLETMYRGKMGFSVKADVGMTNKKGKTLRIRPSLPLVSLDAFDASETKSISFEAGVLDDILSGLSKTGLSVYGLSLDFSKGKIVLDRESFVDMSLMVDIPLRMKFGRFPIHITFPAPEIPVDVKDRQDEDDLLRSLALDIDVRTTLPLGFKIISLSMLDKYGDELEGGRIPIDFDFKHSPDGIEAVDSKLRVGLSIEQVKRLQKANKIKLSSELKSSDTWVELRQEHSVQCRVIAVLNPK